MVLTKRKQTFLEGERIAPVPKAKPSALTAEEFCKERGIGGCCAEAIKRTWKTLRG